MGRFTKAHVGPERPAVEHRILDAWSAAPPRVPVLVGDRGSGRSTLLLRLADRVGSGRCLYVDVERAASTPEALWTAVEAATPYAAAGEPSAGPEGRSPRAAFDSLLAHFEHARGHDGGSAAFLLDEVLELRAFGSFPGLRDPLPELVRALERSSNRFVLSTRFVTRAQRLFQARGVRFLLLETPPLSAPEVAAALVRAGVGRDRTEYGDLTRLVHALTCGRPAYVAALARALAAAGGGDPAAVLAAQLAGGEALHQACRLDYEMRLGRARGHGSLKAILQVLAAEQPLTLTAIARRLGRTAGSTRDYLSWLADVDLIRVERKRYAFSDPLLRAWVRLHTRLAPPGKTDLEREAHEYAVARLPYMEPAPALPEPPRRPRRAPVPARTRSIIEID